MQPMGLLIAVLGWGAVAAAQVGDARRPQLDAAVAHAVEGLYRDVARTPLSGATTVGDLLENVGGRDELMRILQGAQEIGGPRWLDDQTAQVRLEISGTRVAQAVIQLAASNPRRTPVRADALTPLLLEWQHRTFSAIGTSTGAAAAAGLRPAAIDSAWAEVPEEARRAALDAARRDAARRLLDKLEPIELKPGLTVRQLMDQPSSSLRGDLERYLMNRPVTGVQFRPDRHVEIGLAAPGSEVAGALRNTATRAGGADLADVDWSRVTREIERTVSNGTGIGTAAVQQPGASLPEQVLVPEENAKTFSLPEEPPEWAWRQIDADAMASREGSALKCARAAERAAVDKLRAQIEALPLNGMTVGEAARKNARVADAISRGLQWARVYKTDYQADGAARVYVSLELRDVWEQLRRR